MGCSPWGHKDLGTSERLTLTYLTQKDTYILRVLIASAGRSEVPKWQEELKLQLVDFFLVLFSLKVLCCHDNTCFCLNLTLFEILSLPMHFSHGNVFLKLC